MNNGLTSHQHKIDSIETTEQRKQKVSRETDWDDIIAEKLLCKIKNLRRCCFVPITRNSVFDGLRTDLYSIKGCK